MKVVRLTSYNEEEVFITTSFIVSLVELNVPLTEPNLFWTEVSLANGQHINVIETAERILELINETA